MLANLLAGTQITFFRENWRCCIMHTVQGTQLAWCPPAHVVLQSFSNFFFSYTATNLQKQCGIVIRLHPYTHFSVNRNKLFSTLPRRTVQASVLSSFKVPSTVGLRNTKPQELHVRVAWKFLMFWQENGTVGVQNSQNNTGLVGIC